MIRINLLPQKKARKAVEVKSEQTLALVFLGLVGACVGVYFFVHVPLADSVDKAKAANARIESSIRALKEATKDFDIIAAQKKAAEDRRNAIQALEKARIVPSWALRELASVLTKDHKPTMTPEMVELVKNDRNRTWTQTWDAKRVWIDSFEERGGNFTLRGSAQSDGDFTQFALRLQASIFFQNVIPEGGRVNGGLFSYTITGRVVY